jgi:predicted transcriptional regulator
MDSRASDAARLLTEHGRPGLIVVDANDHPVAILPGSQVLRFLIPRYVQDDPALARVLDEEYADNLCDALADKTVRDLLPKDRVPLPVVAPDDTMLEIAAIMAANRCPLVAVVESNSKTAPMIGAISASRLLAHLMPAKAPTDGS